MIFMLWTNYTVAG